MIYTQSRPWHHLVSRSTSISRLPRSRTTLVCVIRCDFIIFNTKFLVFDKQSLVFDSQFLVFNANFIIVTHRSDFRHIWLFFWHIFWWNWPLFLLFLTDFWWKLRQLAERYPCVGCFEVREPMTFC